MTHRKPPTNENFDWDDVDWSEFDWDAYDWDDDDIGQYTNLCPDKRRADFEYGAYCIAKSIQLEMSFRETLKEPSRVRGELDHLNTVIGKLSPQALAALNGASRKRERDDCFLKIVRRLDEVPDLFSTDAAIRKKAEEQFSSPAAYSKEMDRQAKMAFERFSSEDQLQLYKIQSAPRVLDTPMDQFLKVLKLASSALTEGKRGPDHVREALSRDALAIWYAHGGDVDDDNLLDFVERLIDASGCGDINGKKARISPDALVRDMKKAFAEHGAPAWSLWGD